MIKEIVNRDDWQPVCVRAGRVDLFGDLQNFIDNRSGIIVVNQIEEQLHELFLLRHPEYRFDKNYQSHLDQYIQDHFSVFDNAGNWFYFPWDNKLVHYLDETEHNELRTGRNRFLINADEQNRYYEARIGVMGMSVGSHVALTITMTGGAKHLRLADLDTISGSNLNRIRSGFSSLGLSKVKAVARQIFEINPYSDIKIYPDGISDDNIDDFFSSNDGLQLVIEEMDNPYLKLRAREVARASRVPMIMAADNGDGVIVDIERYDIQPDRPLLHGILGDMHPRDLVNIDPKQLPNIIAKMAGADFASARMLSSVDAVGKTIYSWPQLGTAATLCGSTLANLARRIVIGEQLSSGRFVVDELEMFKPVNT
ncbi:MAG: ThiF family adenylyltransferase [Candidatus Magasanikbacteria bacterium]